MERWKPRCWMDRGLVSTELGSARLTPAAPSRPAKNPAQTMKSLHGVTRRCASWPQTSVCGLGRCLRGLDSGRVVARLFDFRGFLIEDLQFTKNSDGKAELQLKLSWTFPMSHVEIITGDGQTVTRERIDMPHAPAFGRETIVLDRDYGGQRWLRVEAWDVATNGAFTQAMGLQPTAK